MVQCKNFLLGCVSSLMIAADRVMGREKLPALSEQILNFMPDGVGL